MSRGIRTTKEQAKAPNQASDNVTDQRKCDAQDCGETFYVSLLNECLTPFIKVVRYKS